MLSVLLLRAGLIALPFAAWFVWRALARSRGHEPGATPWAWLVAGAGLLVGLSLLATAVFHRDTRGEVYVPGEARADGSVSEGRFEKPPAP